MKDLTLDQQKYPILFSFFCADRLRATQSLETNSNLLASADTITMEEVNFLTNNL